VAQIEGVGERVSDVSHTEVADNNLREAIIAHAIAHDLCDDVEMLGDFGVIAHWHRMDGSRVGRSTYTTHFSQNPCPNHIAVGLFEVGIGLAESDEEDDDDE
jgi:hypothetical protein